MVFFVLAYAEIHKLPKMYRFFLNSYLNVIFHGKVNRYKPLSGLFRPIRNVEPLMFHKNKDFRKI